MGIIEFKTLFEVLLLRACFVTLVALMVAIVCFKVYKHIARLKKGQCTIELGFILSDLLNDYARISDHCSNIAVALIEVEENHFDTHEYLNAVKNADNPEFVAAFNSYKEKYALPKASV